MPHALKKQYSMAVTTKAWLSTLIFFSDSRFQLTVLNEKPQGLEKPTDVMLIIITASGKTFKLYINVTSEQSNAFLNRDPNDLVILEDPQTQYFEVVHMPLFIYLFICAGFSSRSLGSNPGTLHAKFAVGEAVAKASPTPVVL
jgi:hypothetical protein